MKKLLFFSFLLMGAVFTVNAQTANTMSDQERMEKHQEYLKQKEAMAEQKAEIAKKVENTTGKAVNAKYTADQKKVITAKKEAEYKAEYQAMLDKYRADEKVATTTEQRARLQAAIQELEEKLANMK